MAVSDLIQGLKGNKFSASESEDLTAFLDRAYVRLDAWFQWFNATQSGSSISLRFDLYLIILLFIKNSRNIKCLVVISEEPCK